AVRTVMSWAGGSLSGRGRTMIPAGVTLTGVIPSFASLPSRTLENGGTVLWTGAGDIGMSAGAVITNRAGALFHAQNAARLSGSGVSRFDNAGTFRKSASTGPTTLLSVSFNNSGTVEIQTGT